MYTETSDGLYIEPIYEGFRENTSFSAEEEKCIEYLREKVKAFCTDGVKVSYNYNPEDGSLRSIDISKREYANSWVGRDGIFSAQTSRGNCITFLLSEDYPLSIEICDKLYSSYRDLLGLLKADK